MRKLNLGCGTNRLDGWENFDADIDITKPLPWARHSADFMLAEHVVEHVTYHEALTFFRECRRVLKHGGVLRIAVPSIEQIWREASDSYCRWVHFRGWSATPDARGAILAIINQHGHQAAWTASLLATTLYAAGFETIVPRDPGLSDHEHLRCVEGHGKVIGDGFNVIETIVCEAS